VRAAQHPEPGVAQQRNRGALSPVRHSPAAAGISLCVPVQ